MCDIFFFNYKEFIKIRPNTVTSEPKSNSVNSGCFISVFVLHVMLYQNIRKKLLGRLPRPLRFFYTNKCFKNMVEILMFGNMVGHVIVVECLYLHQLVM